MSAVLEQAAAALCAVSALEAMGCQVLLTRADPRLQNFAQVWIAAPEPLLDWLDRQPPSEIPRTLAHYGVLLGNVLVVWPRADGVQAAA